MTLQKSSLIKDNKVLESLFNTMPYVFWKDRDGRYQGANLNQARNLGFQSPAEFIGKTIYEILEDQESARKIDEIDNKVMIERVTLIQEERMIAPNGERVYFSQKSPLYDEGKIVGMIGFSMDITDIKKEQEKIQKEKDELLKFSTQADIASQVAHDIRSPLASLLVLVKCCTEISERERIALREVATRIQDIADNLLNKYEARSGENGALENSSQSMLVSTSLLQLLSEKKLQYKQSQINFDYEFSQTGYFAFINIDAAAFKRMISNVINNAVEAIIGQAGKVLLKLNADKENIIITVQDNGKGMSTTLVEKILNNIAVTEGKNNGHGIGLTQTRNTLQQYQGKLSIQSKIGYGTDMIFTFPRINAPNWIAERIKLNTNDIIIVLDDDMSIHGAWNTQFATILKDCPNLQIKHFDTGEDTLDYINGLEENERQRVLLLSDHELLNQTLNGLDVIEKSKLSCAILVTSHYANKKILDRAISLGVKVLPKQLVSEVPIMIEVSNKEEIIIIEDEEYLSSAITYFLRNKKKVTCYKNPYDFLSKLDQYSKTIKIYLDYDLKIPEMNGVKLAKQLHLAGYNNLYLLSGRDFKTSDLPDYLTFIAKTDLENIEKF